MKHSARQFLPLALLGLLIIFMAAGIRGNDRKQEQVSPMVGREFPVMTIAGTQINLSSDHQVALINLFASWCAPCAIEQPALVAFAQRNIATVKGIAWKNTEADAMAFLAQRGNPYKQVVLDASGDTTIPLGLTGVPESFLIDKNGIIRYHTKQPLTNEMLNGEIGELAMRLQKE